MYIPPIHRLNEAITSTGLILPETQLLEIDDKKALENQIVIVPPALLGTNMIKKFQILLPQFVLVGCK
jgi:putative mRNA 3-end processing factor